MGSLHLEKAKIDSRKRNLILKRGMFSLEDRRGARKSLKEVYSKKVYRIFRSKKFRIFTNCNFFNVVDQNLGMDPDSQKS
jgi:hypothetical protein